jgi:cytoskeletal protein CcmA (bactofilin family)
MLKSDNRKNMATETSASTSPSPPVSILGPSLTFKGEISGTQDLVIHGQVQGKINLEGQNITLARTARVKADIHTQNIIIQGSMEGDVQATGKAIIESNGHMNGSLTAARISIAEGAVFKGSLKILSRS